MKIFQRVSLFLLLFALTVEAASFLMPDQAFKPYAKVNDKAEIVAGVKIAPEIYLYKEKLKVTIVSPKTVQIAKIDAPKAVDHMGDAVYFKSPEFILHLKKTDALHNVRDIKVKISYQGCSEQGLCYEPTEKIFDLHINSNKVQTAANLQSLQPLQSLKQDQNSKKRSKTDLIANTIKSSSFFVVMATFFIFGLLLSLTPCVFPMIPIISGLIVSQGEGLTTKKAFLLSVVYVLAMAVAYTIAGVLAGLFGANLQAALQTPWVVYSFSALFVALAFSMFGFYELKLPDALVSRVSKNSNRSGFIGVAIMGFLSALIVGPCVAAPLAGALVYIGQTGDALLGGSALFIMSIGMGLPLIVVGVSAGKFMPKPGAWMTMVNAVFGVIMLGVAIWMLQKVVSAEITTLLFGMLGIGFSLYLGAFEREGHIFKRSVALILFLYCVALFISALAGAASMTEPLAFLKTKEITVTSEGETKSKLHFTKITSLNALNALLKKSRGKKVLLDFSAAWCTACKELEERTFSDPKVIAKLQDFVLIRADVTQNGADEKALSKAYGVFGPPAVLFFDKEGKLMNEQTIIGFVEPKEFLEHIDF
jgi:thiol:disulfide interchange protein DsbD